MANKPHHTVDPRSQPPSLTIDWTFYASQLEGSDLSDDQKRELIETLWNIVVSCVDLGFGVHPLQQGCEHSSETTQDAPADLLSLLENIPSNHNQNVANCAAHSLVDKEES
jgi:hypothetical protein